MNESASKHFNPEIERVVISTALTFPMDAQKHMATMPVEIFHEAKNRILWGALKELMTKSKPIDIITMNHHLRSNGELEKIGGTYILSSEYFGKATHSGHIDEHILLLKQLYIIREQERICQSVLYEINTERLDPLELLSRNKKALDDLSQYLTPENEREFPTMVDDTIKEAEKRQQKIKDGKVTGVTSGIMALDRKLGGFQNGDFVIVAGRPGMGKTSLALHFLKSSAIENKKTILFSLEMNAERIIDKLILSQISVDGGRYLHDALNDEEWNEVVRAKGQIKELPIHINDFANASMSYIRSMCKVKKAKSGLDLVVVDYLQLIRPETMGKNFNRENEVANMSRLGKVLAKELNVPVIMLCQMSRLVEIRGGDHRPKLSDLRESGAIEQDADQVLFVYRPSYYGIQGENGESLEGVGEIIIAKNRNGATGTCWFRHSMDMTQFFELEEIRESKQSSYKQLTPF